MKTSYWTIEEGIWSPRDKHYGWRPLDTYQTQVLARKAIRSILKDDPDAVLMLTQTTVYEAWNNDKAPSWASASEAA